MIYTVTLNPALDYVIQTPHFKTGQFNRNTSEHIYFGGKGINVSCVLKELGVESTAVGFIAGFTGKALRDGLAAMQIRTDLVEVSEGMTRINVKVRSDDETEINGMGPVITDDDLRVLIGRLKKAGPGDMLVISGSIPSCLSSRTYEQILEEINPDVRLVVDAEKGLLLNILRFHPFLIKPNSIELGQMFDTVLNSKEEIIQHARKLQELGARNVLVSMAADGALLLDENGVVHEQRAARGTVVNSVGAGDSMVAGFLAGYLETGSYDHALKLGTACGGATAFHSGLATKQQIDEIMEML
ncbi:MAG: 1-phosphofructokinase [Solobacterium sp.]|nr:1-phosphofructokinase [Solobacterium sp.]